MKKRIMLLTMLVTMGLAGMTGCGAAKTADTEVKTVDTEETGLSQIANPWTSFDSLEEAVKASGIELNVPETIAGFDSVVYQNMGTDIIEVLYRTGADENASEISVRKGASEDVVNGDYNEYKDVTTESISGAEVTLKADGEKTFAASYNKDGSFYYIFANNGMSKDDMITLVSDIIEKN